MKPKPKYTLHFGDVFWSYYGQLNMHHILNGHGVRMYLSRTTKHKPPRTLCILVFPGLDKSVQVYVTTKTIDDTIHHHCTPVRKIDKLPAHLSNFKGDLCDFGQWARENTGNGNLSQQTGTP